MQGPVAKRSAGGHADAVSVGGPWRRCSRSAYSEVVRHWRGSGRDR